MDTASAVNGGDLGRFAPEMMVPEFSDALMAAQRGQIIRIESDYGVHIAKLTYSSKPVRKAQIATIVYEVVASDATIQQATNKAGEFIAAINKSDFNNAVAELNLVKRNAVIGGFDRNVRGFDNAREMVRWAYNNKVGEVSSAMEIDGDYIVAVVAGVKDEEYTPINEVSAQIAARLRSEAKAAYVAEQVKGAATIEEAAEILGAEIIDAEEVKGNATAIMGVGPDAKLVGAISAAEENVLGTIGGNSGAYVYVVTGRKILENSTVESAKPLFESMATRNLINNINNDLTELSNVEDNRVKFF
jgi:peptidyl-prolyl cis-trans isomerase D